jgi:mannose-6-phosphate isomerase-like protein (cupin superfamily)
MKAHDISELLTARRGTSTPYLEFVRTPSMSAGIYELPESGEDAQTPHGEDELYYVLAGRATLRVGGEDRAVSAGGVIFVPARVEHAFHSIREPLSLLVVFAPPEGSGSRRTARAPQARTGHRSTGRSPANRRRRRR